MSDTKVKNGSYKVHVPIGGRGQYVTRLDNDSAVSLFPSDFEQTDKSVYTVSMLTQNEYAHGWRQVLPRRRVFIKRIKNKDTDEMTERIGTNVYKLKVNLAQLPYYLWSRIRPTHLNQQIINDNNYQYTVEYSNVDDEVRELVSIMNNGYNVSNRERVTELLNVLKDNDVFGWVVIKASALYH